MHSFLRVAHSVWAILSSPFLVVNTNYFDDFVSLAAEPELASVDFTVKAVFKLLGWKFAQDGPKAPPFSPSLKALGISIDVSELRKGLVKIDNTASRREELALLISQVISSGDALRLRGRMQFASGQLHGRVSKRCLAIITQHAYCSENASLDVASIHALERFHNLLMSNEPRTLSMRCAMCWYIFTDASFEPEASPPFAAIGAVLVDHNGRKVKFFSEELSKDPLGATNVTDRRTIIFECEFFAVFCALVTWQDELRQSNVVVHTDNDGVRDSFKSCHTTSRNALPILDACLKYESEIQANVWITRVPTESNVSDDPSRLVVQHFVDSGCCRNNLDCQMLWGTMVCPTGTNEEGEASDQFANAMEKTALSAVQLRGSADRNLGKETNGARPKFQADVMSAHDSTEMFQLKHRS